MRVVHTGIEEASTVLRIMRLAFAEKLGYRVLESDPYPVGTDVSVTLGKDLGVENR